MDIAIIPARGGSKRIPRKNIKEFCGKPMIAYSINAAIKSECFDEIIVSTDDEEIANVAVALGAKVPFMRPKELADDHTGTIPVICHAIETLEKQTSKKITNACCIYATAPFLQALDIKTGFNLLNHHKNAFYAFSVTSYAFPIQRAIKLNSDKSQVEMFQPEMFNVRSQDLEDAYHDAGQFYWGKRDAWLEGKSIFSVGSIPVILPRYRVQDIDTLEDWQCAELMFDSVMKRD